MNSDHYKTPAMPVVKGFALESGRAEKNDAIGSGILLVLAIGSMISLSSCATGNAHHSPSRPPDHGATALPAPVPAGDTRLARRRPLAAGVQ